MQEKKNKSILKGKRIETLKIMKEQNEELKILENEILDVGLKAQTLKTENDKFIQAIKELEVDYTIVDNRIIDTNQSQEFLQQEFNKLHQSLIEGWKSDKNIEEIFANNDRKLIQRLDELLNKSKKREQEVQFVAGKIYKEIEDLEFYLSSLVGKAENSEISNYKFNKNTDILNKSQVKIDINHEN